ncbi:MAG: FAD:protein FMN transferase [Thermogutta sp.]
MIEVRCLWKPAILMIFCLIGAVAQGVTEGSEGLSAARSETPTCSGVVPQTTPRPEKWTWESVEMAAPLRIICYYPEEESAKMAMRKAVERIRELNNVFSDYDTTSEVRRLCETAGLGRKVRVSDDLWRLLEISLNISQQTDGAFDVTVGPLSRLWRRARMSKEMPPAWRFEEAKQVVGYQLVKMDPVNRTVELLRPGMRLDFGAVAKGYAIDAALAVMQAQGVTSALVDLGGDIGLGDPPPDRPTWNVGVAPLEPGQPPSIFVRTGRCGIATSGDRYRFVVIAGQRYSHIIDPRTGVGLTEQSEVTVIAPNATLADTLATAVTVLGPEKGLAWIDTMPDVAALYLRLENGQTRVLSSNRWRELSGNSGDTR